MGGSRPNPVIEPAARRPWAKPTFPSDTDPSFAYATPHEDDAWNYAEKAWHSTSHGRPRVFQVESLGDHEEDPAFDQHGRSRSNFTDDRRSQQGWRVLREMPMPEHMGTPEDWR